MCSVGSVVVFIAEHMKYSYTRKISRDYISKDSEQVLRNKTFFLVLFACCLHFCVKILVGFVDNRMRAEGIKTIFSFKLRIK
jgi:site-specific recombinase